MQQRLAAKIQANPGSETLVRILRLLFSPEEAELAGKLPHNLTPIEDLSRSLAIPLERLNDTVTRMAQRGVLFDMECAGRRYVTLPPVVIGFFEFVFMRARPDLPMQERAHLFEHYFHEHDGAMAIERDRLAEMIFDDPQRLTHRALGRVVRVLEKSPPFKAAMASASIKSTFLKALVKGAKRQAGDLGRFCD